MSERWYGRDAKSTSFIGSSVGDRRSLEPKSFNRMNDVYIEFNR